MKSHTGEKARHPFTSHINVIRVPNSKTVFAICKWCKLKHDTNQQLMQPFLAQEYSLAFNWVEKKSSIAMLKYKNPNLVIPSHHTLGGHVLKNTIQELHLELSLAAKYVSPEDDDLTLSENICEPIGDNNWWNTISELHILLSPLYTARLYEVLHIFGYLYNLMDKYSDITFEIKMIERLEQCWREWEQPFLILSFLLHPDIRLTQFKLPIN
ncbi:10718_t:CDS:2, partial [Dentiscutata heterogama]